MAIPSFVVSLDSMVNSFRFIDRNARMTLRAQQR